MSYIPVSDVIGLIRLDRLRKYPQPNISWVRSFEHLIAGSKRANLHPDISLGPLQPPKHRQVSLNVQQLPYQLRFGRARFTLFSTIVTSNKRLSYNDGCLRICFVKSAKKP